MGRDAGGRGEGVGGWGVLKGRGCLSESGAMTSGCILVNCSKGKEVTRYGRTRGHQPGGAETAAGRDMLMELPVAALTARLGGASAQAVELYFSSSDSVSLYY